MKAVIMAGGKGTRLRPLTCHLPKPMVPLLDKPCMEYIIELLKRHGITEIAVTVQYLPQTIQNYFGDGRDLGIHLHYFEEMVPLGTAGSVKNAESFLDETFLVISGDALTDFDLQKAIEFHKEKEAIGTLVLTKVDVPLDYGVVMTQEDGRIIRFLEKPNWSEVFSDTVNTGIYVMEPEILQFFEQGQTFDFSKDLFPLVMANQLPLYGYIAEGYWSDIGNLQQYKQTQFDMLEGRVDLQIKGEQKVPGIWVEEGVDIHPEAEVIAPAFIGTGSRVEAEAKVQPFSVLGCFTRVAKGVVIEKSVVWDRNFIEQGAYLSGTLLCDSIQVGAGAQLLEGSVVGEKSRIGEMAVIKPKVKIWPEKKVAEKTIQNHSLIHALSAEPRLFSEGGIKGIPNMDLTPEKVSQISAAFGSCLKLHSTVTVGSDDHPYSRIFRQTVIASLMAAGIHVRDAGETLAPVVRYDVRQTNSAGAVYIKKHAGEERRMVLQFYDAQGLPIDSSWERKVEHAYRQEDFSRPQMYDAGYYNPIGNAGTLYLEEVLSQVSASSIRKQGYRVDVHCSNTHVWSIVKPLLHRLGCHAHFWSGNEPETRLQTGISQADLVVDLDEDVSSLRLYSTEKGWLSTEKMLVLQLLLAANKQPGVAVPVEAPSNLKPLLEQKGGKVTYTKSSTRSLLEAGVEKPLQVFADGIYLLVSILEELAEKQWKSSQPLIDSIPAFHMVSERVECPIEAKGRVMRRLMEEMKEQPVELLDGIKVFADDGWALILPDSEKALFKVIAQGKTPDRAGELTSLYKNKIIAYQQM